MDNLYTVVMRQALLDNNVHISLPICNAILSQYWVGNISCITRSPLNDFQLDRRQ